MRTREQARGKCHSPPVNVVAVLGWRSRVEVRTVQERDARVLGMWDIPVDVRRSDV